MNRYVPAIRLKFISIYRAPVFVVHEKRPEVQLIKLKVLYLNNELKDLCIVRMFEDNEKKGKNDNGHDNNGQRFTLEMYNIEFHWTCT